MCGKFTQVMSWSALVEHADLVDVPRGPLETVTPMRFAHVIRLNAEGRREAVRMRWGLVPRGQKDPTSGPVHIHARAEGIEGKRTFADAFARRRGLVVVSTFNEGEEVSPTRRVQHVISPNDGKPIAIGVIWEEWGNLEDGTLLTFAMVTVAANALIGAITDRMPAIVEPQDWAQWLGEVPATPDALKAMLKPFEGDWTMRPQGSAKKTRSSQPPLF